MPAAAPLGAAPHESSDLDEFQRRSTERLLILVERSRPSIERELGQPFTVAETDGRVELTVAGRPVYVNGRVNTALAMLARYLPQRVVYALNRRVGRAYRDAK